MLIRLEAYAIARERLGFSVRLLELDVPLRIGDVVALLARDQPGAAETLAASRYAVNDEYAALDRQLADQDTLAILPPVSGGAPDLSVKHSVVSTDPVDVDAAARRVQSAAAGAVVLFVGTVRAQNDQQEVIAIEYEAKVGMAEQELERLISMARERFHITDAFIQHRIGRVTAGDASAVIATSAAHRAAAYEANAWLLDELKKIVPIWKHEERLIEGKSHKVWLGQGGG